MYNSCVIHSNVIKLHVFLIVTTDFYTIYRPNVLYLQNKRFNEVTFNEHFETLTYYLPLLF